MNSSKYSINSRPHNLVYKNLQFLIELNIHNIKIMYSFYFLFLLVLTLSNRVFRSNDFDFQQINSFILEELFDLSESSVF